MELSENIKKLMKIMKAGWNRRKILKTVRKYKKIQQIIKKL